jgi:hypothetical protein
MADLHHRRTRTAPYEHLLAGLDQDLFRQGGRAGTEIVGTRHAQLPWIVIGGKAAQRKAAAAGSQRYVALQHVCKSIRKPGFAGETAPAAAHCRSAPRLPLVTGGKTRQCCADACMRLHMATHGLRLGQAGWWLAG